MTEKEVEIKTTVPRNVLEFLDHLSNCVGWHVNVWLRREIRMVVEEVTAENHIFWDGKWLREKYRLDDFLSENSESDESLNYPVKLK